MEKIRRDFKNVAGNEKEVYIRQNSRTTYDLNSVYKTVPSDDFHRLVNINKKALEGYMISNPVVKERVTSAAITNYTSPFLSVKKVKKLKKKKGEK